MRKPILDQSQTRPYDWACKGRSAEMAAWQHLVLEEGYDDEPGMEASPAVARVKVGVPLGLPKSSAQDHPRGLQLSTTCVAASQFSASSAVWDCAGQRRNHRRFGLLLCHPAHVVHLALRLSDKQVATTAIDEVRGLIVRSATGG